MSLRNLSNGKFASILGMVHIGPLPGVPRHRKSIMELIDNACEEAETFRDHKLDGIILENMHDIPYNKARYIGPEIIASMSTIAKEVRRTVPYLPIGIQILAGANREALAVALAADLDFIRAEGFVFSHIADEGFIDGCAGPLLRYRKNIGAEHIKVFTDIKKKHSSHSITGDISLEEASKAALFFLSDGVIITGSQTGDPVNPQVFQDLKQKLPSGTNIMIGSGVSEQNVNFFKEASALIVGSHFKNGGIWSNALDLQRIRTFMDKVSLWKY